MAPQMETKVFILAGGSTQWSAMARWEIFKLYATEQHYVTRRGGTKYSACGFMADAKDMRPPGLFPGEKGLPRCRDCLRAV